MNTVLEAIQKRSSTRGYETRELSAKELQAIITAGLEAPTAANKQEIHFSVLKGSHPVLEELEKEKNRLRNIDTPPHNFYYEAPTVIILSGDSTYKWSALDAGIAVENMAIAAESMGLGSLIIGCIYDTMRGEKKEQFAKACQFPENYEYEIAIALGYKAVTKEPHTFDEKSQVTFVD